MCNVKVIHWSRCSLVVLVLAALGSTNGDGFAKMIMVTSDSTKHILGITQANKRVHQYILITLSELTKQSLQNGLCGVYCTQQSCFHYYWCFSFMVICYPVRCPKWTSMFTMFSSLMFSNRQMKVIFNGAEKVLVGVMEHRRSTC